MDEFKATIKSIFVEGEFSEHTLPVVDHAMKLVIKFSGFFQNLIDNMLWVVTVGVIRK